MKRKVALVTGSNRGIGKSCIEDFARAGVNVVINYCHHEDEAEELEKYIKENYDVEVLTIKCDISKVAYMPKNKKDVINLLEAVSEIKDFPIIAISMGKLGIITRIFGSVITFASAKSSSAPGQIEAMKLKYILDNLYN